MSEIDAEIVKRAKDGDAEALDAVVRGVQDQMHRLAARMLGEPEAAMDATQEILIRIVTKLSTFEGQSRFETWAYRVGVNYLLTARKVIAADPGLNFQMFGADLLEGLADDESRAPEDHVMLNELRVRCTMAMLLCLDRAHRAAYVLGEILEMEHGPAAEILDVSPANYRKRLSRARSEVQGFTAASCGIANRSAKCSCSRRLPVAMAKGRVPAAPSGALNEAPSFTEARREAERVGADLVAATMQRATGPIRAPKDYAAMVLSLVDPPGRRRN